MLGLVFAQNSFCQVTVINKTVNPNVGFIYRVETMGFHIDDGTFDRGMNEQLGVVGNDFYKRQKIGQAPAEEKQVKDTWYPIREDDNQGYKTTAVGILKNVYRRGGSYTADILSSPVGQESDDDWNFYVLPGIKTGSFLQSRYNKYKNLQLPVIAFEIDLTDRFIKYFDQFDRDYIPQKNNYIAAYGPLVTDQGHSKKDKNLNTVHQVEVHPAEQIWWTRLGKDRITHYLFTTSDNSKRFDQDDDYDKNYWFDDDPSYYGPWVTNPMQFYYALPFEVKPDQRRTFNINTVTLYEYCVGCSKESYDRTVASQEITLKDFLVYNNDTLVQVNFKANRNLKYEFVNVGVDPKSFLLNKDTLIKGFLVLSRLVNAGSHTVDKVERVLQTDLLDKKAKNGYEYQVTLKSITCLDVGDDDGEKHHSSGLREDYLDNNSFFVYGPFSIGNVRLEDFEYIITDENKKEIELTGIVCLNVFNQALNCAPMSAGFGPANLLLKATTPLQLKQYIPYAINKSKTVLVKDFENFDLSIDAVEHDKKAVMMIPGAQPKGKREFLTGATATMSPYQFQLNRTEAFSMDLEKNGTKVRFNFEVTLKKVVNLVGTFDPHRTN